MTNIKLPMDLEKTALNQPLLTGAATTWRADLAVATRSANDTSSTTRRLFLQTPDICLPSTWEQLSQWKSTTESLSGEQGDRTSHWMQCLRRGQELEWWFNKQRVGGSFEVHARHFLRYAGPIDCPLQTYAPEGEPLHRVVEEYADDQNAWLRDFLPVGWAFAKTWCNFVDIFQALQKMVENKANDLLEAPTGWWDAECVYQKRKHIVCE